MRKQYVIITCMIVIILTGSFFLKLSYSPFVLGNISFGLVELCEDEDIMFLPFKKGRFVKYNPKEVIFLNQYGDKIGGGQILSYQYSDEYISIIEGQLETVFSFTNSHTDIYEYQVHEIQIEYGDNNVESFPVQNFTIVRGNCKKSDYANGSYYELGNFYVVPWIYKHNEEPKSILVLESFNDNINVLNVGRFNQNLEDGEVFPLAIKASERIEIPLKIPAVEKQFQILKPIAYSVDGIASSCTVTPPIRGAEYVKGRKVK